MARGSDARYRLRTQQAAWAGRFGEIGLAAAVLAVVVMMVVPLTPWLIDLLIGVNFCFSLLLLSMALFVRQPLVFTAFPTVILVATLYRLALNISSTRLILIRADAGKIISGFGGYMIGDDILVGAVIFGILALVLFLVITKGAERVAEVAARFSLDALPGLQLAIDSDLRQGALSALEASRKREALERKSRYFGALDGAMKFVRGDALAALCIIGVNIVGGLAVGMLRRGLSAGDAIDVYGRLAVGDGLVTMIPALLISTAAGLLVTRVGQDDAADRFGAQVARQLISEPRALAAASALLLALASVRGLPAWPFLLFSAVLGVAAVFQFKAEMSAGSLQTDRAEAVTETTLRDAAAVVEMGASLFYELSAGPRAWRSVSRGLADTLQRELGIPIAIVPITQNDAADTRELRLKIKGVLARRMVVPEGTRLCIGPQTALLNARVSPLVGAGDEEVWICETEADMARHAGMQVFSLPDGVRRQLERWLREKAGRLIGIDEAETLVIRVAATRPVLVRETVPKVIDLPHLARLLSTLANDGIRVDILPEVLEIIGRHPDMADPFQLAEQVRSELAALITEQLRHGSEPLRVMMLGHEIESVLEGGLVTGSMGPAFALADEDIAMIIEACRRAAAEVDRPVLITSPHLRRPVADLLALELPRFRVVKSAEIEPDVSLEVTTTVEVSS